MDSLVRPPSWSAGSGLCPPRVQVGETCLGLRSHSGRLYPRDLTSSQRPHLRYPCTDGRCQHVNLGGDAVQSLELREVTGISEDDDVHLDSLTAMAIVQGLCLPTLAQ